MLCAEDTVEMSAKCLMESNGELLPIILVLEVIWWIMVFFGLRFGFKSLRKRFSRKENN
jgi:hypothetical protein